MHALVCALNLVMKRLLAPAAAAHDMPACARVLLRIMSQVASSICVATSTLPHPLQPPCDMGSRAKDQPQDYSSGDRRAQGRGAPRSLVASLAVLQV